MARYDVTDGETSTGLTLNNDSMYVSAGGTATETTLNQYGKMHVYDGALVCSTTVNKDGQAYVSGGTLNDTAVNSGGQMTLSGGTADSTTVKFGGELFIEETGKADHTTVFVAGTMYVSGSAENTTISGGDVEVRSGGTMTKTKVTTGDTDDYWGSATVSSGGTAINTTVDFHGGFSIHDGGSADIATVAAGGRIYIGEGATVTNITAVDGARLGLAVAPGTYAQGTYAGSAFETKDGAISGYTVHSYGGLDVVNGGVATDITVTERAQVWVADGVLDGITMNGGYMYIANGGKVMGKMRFNGGDADQIEVYDGATVDFDLTRIAPGDEVLVNDISAITGYGTFTLTVDGTEKNGVYKLAEGASDFNKTITVMNTDGGKLGELKVNGEAQTFEDVTYQLTVDGSILTLTVSGAPDLTGDLNTAFTLTDGMYAKKVNVNDGGELEVFGTARKTVINKNGMVYVSAGGLVEDVIVNEGGFLGNHYGVVRGATVSGGEMNVGGQAYDTVVEKDGTVRAYNVLSNTTINAGGCVFAMKGATYNTTVNKGGELVVHAEARDMTVNQGGRLAVSAGGRITGKMTFEEGAFVVVESGATVDFDLTQAAPGEEALLNDLSRITGTPSYRILITGDETEGTYNLAGGAAGFDKTITVYDITISSLSIPRPFVTVGGESVEIGGKKYTLALDDSLLTLTVGDATPPNGPAEPLNNYLYDKKQTPDLNENVTESYGTILNSAGQEIRLDKIGTVDHGEEHYHNHVGKSAVPSDTDYKLDYAKIVLEHGAKLSFHAEATAAATFTVYSLSQNAKTGKYSLKKLHTLKLADKDKDGVFTADSSKQLQLQVSGTYYVSMEFKDKKAGEAYYNVTLNDSGKNPSVFYPLGDNTDDWGDMKTEGYAGAVGDLGVINGARLEADKTVIRDEWIGFGDKADYKKFTLESAAELSLKVNAPDGPLKLTVCKLKETTKKDVTTYSQTNVKSVSVSAKQGTASLSSLQLEAGDYFFRVDSGDVKKSTGYSVQITDSTFYTDGDNGWNNWLYDKKDNAVNEVMGSYVGTYAETWIDFDYDVYHDDYYNFVGFGDTCDYSEIYVDEEGLYNFRFDTTGKAKFTVYSLTRNSKGKWTQKVLGSQTISDVNGATGATLKKDVKLSATDGNLRYFVSMQAVDTKKSPEVYYNVMSFPTAVSVADALSMPTDAPIFGQFEADALADVSAASFAELDGKSAWQTVANLA